MPLKKGKPVLVREHQADGFVREIFQQMRGVCGVPHVSVVFQAYAAHPKFLELHWRVAKPLLETQEFFSLAERLRAEAYTRMHNYFRIPDLCAQMTDLSFSPGARNELTDVAELFHFQNPVLLLLMAAQMQAFDKAAGREGEGTRPASHPEFNEKPVLVEEETASGAVKKIYDDIKRTLGVPIINTDFRALARWPDFLREYWTVLKSLVQSPVYIESCQGIRGSGLNLAHELPEPFELTVAQLQDAGLDDADVEAAVRLTETFLKVLSGQVLNMAVAKIGLEGGNVATSARTAA
jgi:hypothetical protein